MIQKKAILSETSSKDKHKNEHKRSISDDVTEKKKEFNKNFEDTETITKINVEQNNKTGDYSSSNTSQKSQNESEKIKISQTRRNNISSI